MGQQFHHRTKEDRHLIATLQRRKHTQGEIARVVGCSERMIRRELRRGVAASREYNVADAHQKKLARRKRSKYIGMKIDAHSHHRAFIVAALEASQRPETIAGRIHTFHPELPPITAKSIYNWLYSPQGQQYAYLLLSKRYKAKRR